MIHEEIAEQEVGLADLNDTFFATLSTGIVYYECDSSTRLSDISKCKRLRIICEAEV